MTDDEKDRALCEAHCNSAADEYFKARPQLDSSANRRIFYAGHRKAWIERGEAVRLNAQAVPNTREMFNAGWCAAARFCDREDVVYDGLVGPGGCPAFEVAYRAAFTALSAAPAAPQPAQPLDSSVMELAESVGLIGPASRTDDLHEAIQRFHDLIVVNASIKAARHFADGLAQQPLTDEQCDAIYMALDNWAREFDEYEFGLPHSCGGGVEGGREIIRNAHGIGVKND